MKFGDGIDWDNEARRAAKETEAEFSGGGVRANALDLVLKLKEVGADGRILDSGCNIARYCPPLREAGFVYVGVDQSPEALAIARKRYPDVEFVSSFLWDMKFDQPFDVVISMAVLQHNVMSEKRKILACIADAVKIGGHFAMQESTVLETTHTQLRQEQWIALVQEFGFRLLTTWHPNPEYNVNDAYLFIREG